MAAPLAPGIKVSFGKFWGTILLWYVEIVNRYIFFVSWLRKSTIFKNELAGSVRCRQCCPLDHVVAKNFVKKSGKHVGTIPLWFNALMPSWNFNKRFKLFTTLLERSGPSSNKTSERDLTTTIAKYAFGDTSDTSDASAGVTVTNVFKSYVPIADKQLQVSLILCKHIIQNITYFTCYLPF